MNNGKNEHKEQKIGLWLGGGAAGFSVRCGWGAKDEPHSYRKLQARRTSK